MGGLNAPVPTTERVLGKLVDFFERYAGLV
jgi:hypothetical protein